MSTHNVAGAMPCCRATWMGRAPRRRARPRVVASKEQIAGWDVSIPPDGRGLPAGSGTVQEGAAIYAVKCLACHGKEGAGQPNDRLVGGRGTLTSAAPVRTVGSYWPYATTLFDYIKRAMPIFQPQSLSDDEAYALTAYLLNLNGVIAADDKMAIAYYELGMLYVRTSKNADARANLQKYLELDPNGKEAGTAKEMLKYVK